jgi:hypothetical protein
MGAITSKIAIFALDPVQVPLQGNQSLIRTFSTTSSSSTIYRQQIIKELQLMGAVGKVEI